MSTLNRRRLFALGSASVGFVLAKDLFVPARARAEAAAEPHFFLQVVFTGGLDTSYTFDARPLAMTAAKLQVNHGGQAPILYRGSNGQETWIAPYVSPLRSHMSDITVLNGVVMMPAFDGHDNNVGFLISGNPFGGEAMIPHLNEGAAKLPLDYALVGKGRLLTTITNSENSVPLTAESAKAFSQRIQALPSLGGDSPLKTFLHNRMLVNGAGTGKHSAAARAMAESFGKMPPLAESLKAMQIDDQNPDEIAQAASLIAQLFRGNVCRGAMLVFDTDLNQNQNLDNHDLASAQALPQVVTKLMTELAGVFDTLKATPYDATRSLFDVTTIVVGSEFGRTMRQNYAPIEESGTDHNSLTNTILVAGKGIKGGQVFGQTDFQTAEETLSAAHLSFDPKKVRVMGRPYDFATGTPRTDLPAAYQAADYLTFSNVANTIYKLFGAKETHLRVTERNGPPARTLDGLIS